MHAAYSKSIETAALMIEFEEKEKKCLALEAAWRIRKWRRRRRSNSSEEKPNRPQLDYVSNHLLCAEQRWLSVLCVCVYWKSFVANQWQQQQALIHLFQWFCLSQLWSCARAPVRSYSHLGTQHQRNDMEYCDRRTSTIALYAYSLWLCVLM